MTKADTQTNYNPNRRRFQPFSGPAVAAGEPFPSFYFRGARLTRAPPSGITNGNRHGALAASIVRSHP